MDMTQEPMTDAINTIKIFVHDECKKIERYFLSSPKVNCNISPSKEGVKVEVLLHAGGKMFSSHANGRHIIECVKKAIAHLIGELNKDKDIMLRREKSNKSANYKIYLSPEIQPIGQS